MQFKSEFPELLGIKESLIKYVFEPNAAKKDEVRVQVAIYTFGFVLSCRCLYAVQRAAKWLTFAIAFAMQTLAAVKEMRGR